jgi:hypothetical protein
VIICFGGKTSLYILKRCFYLFSSRTTAAKLNVWPAVDNVFNRKKKQRKEDHGNKKKGKDQFRLTRRIRSSLEKALKHASSVDIIIIKEKVQDIPLFFLSGLKPLL